MVQYCQETVHAAATGQHLMLKAQHAAGLTLHAQATRSACPNKAHGSRGLCCTDTTASKALYARSRLRNAVLQPYADVVQ
jgi:hypothetical protein